MIDDYNNLGHLERMDESSWSGKDKAFKVSDSFPNDQRKCRMR